jgi:hypothetical protein
MQMDMEVGKAVPMDIILDPTVMAEQIVEAIWSLIEKNDTAMGQQQQQQQHHHHHQILNKYGEIVISLDLPKVVRLSFVKVQMLLFQVIQEVWELWNPWITAGMKRQMMDSTLVLIENAKAAAALMLVITIAWTKDCPMKERD